MKKVYSRKFGGGGGGKKGENSRCNIKNLKCKLCCCFKIKNNKSHMSISVWLKSQENKKS